MTAPSYGAPGDHPGLHADIHASAQAELRAELGAEIDALKAEVADLKSLVHRLAAELGMPPDTAPPQA